MLNQAFVSVVTRPIVKLEQQNQHTVDDALTVEQPLEIILRYGSTHHRIAKPLSVTMRTPGMDYELALGFLFTEGIINSYADVLSFQFLGTSTNTETTQQSIVIELHPQLMVDLEKLNRHFYTTSSCGVCGKTSIDQALNHACFVLTNGYPQIATSVLYNLPQKLQQTQTDFGKTGGIHACLLCNTNGDAILWAEDVGRHNALDKLIGQALKHKLLPLSNHILVLSGRASFEMMQKAIVAGIPIVAAIGAPSSLAVELAENYGTTLVGFLKHNRANVYTGFDRIVGKH